MATPRTRLEPSPLPRAVAEPLVAALGAAHEVDPFSPRDVRRAARRVVRVAERLELAPVVFRGAVAIGWAELDHVFVVVDGHVLDVALPLGADGFRAAARGWVAGDLTLAELAAAADRHALEERVLGAFPEEVAYRGAPVWSAAA